MAELQVDGAFIKTEPGFFDASGRAKSFYYYRSCDQASDVFLDTIGLGAKARRSINRSTYSATAEIDVIDPIVEGTPVRFSVEVERIGGKSFVYRVTMRHAEDGTVRAIFKTVSVCMDMTGPTPMNIPDEVRQAISGYMTA